jgi:alpha-L-rhamnosidase
VETFKQNALDVFMDCPQRERAGWLCDSYFTSRTAFYLSGNTLIETNFLENFLLPEKFRYIPEGMLPMCYPSDHPDGTFIPNWAMWFVIELEEYVQRSGNSRMAQELQPKVMALLDYFAKYENEDGLLEKLEKWIFLEWSKANDFVQDVSYPTNMLYAKTLEMVAKLYNNPALATKAARIRETIRKQSFDGTFFIDNAIRENGHPVPQKNNRTETCQYYAFFTGTATPETHPALWKILLNDFGPKRKTTKAYAEIYPSNAFIGNYLRLEVLARYGHVKQLLNECIDEYLYMANLTGTLWEHTSAWASCNHGFASHIAHVFYRDMLGLNRIDPVNKQIDVVFNDTGVKSCRGTVPTGDQIISMKWEKKGKTLSYSLSAPEGYIVNIKNNTGLKLENNR